MILRARRPTGLFPTAYARGRLPGSPVRRAWLERPYGGSPGSLTSADVLAIATAPPSRAHEVEAHASWPPERPALARDLRWAAIVAVLLAISPATGSSRLWLSAILGAVGGALVLALRLWRRRRGQAPLSRSVPVARPAWPVLACAVALGVIFAPTLSWLYHEYTASVWRNLHGLFVPLFMFLLGRSALRADPDPERVEASAWGLAFLAAGLGLAVLDAGARTQHLSALGLLLCLPGLSLLFLGARRTRLLAIPLALGVFALPTPEAMFDPLGLTAGTAALAEPLLAALGEPVLRHRTQFILPDGILAVSQNCSGLSTLHAALALCFVLASAARRWTRRVALLLVVYPLTLAANTLRCVAIVAISSRVGLGFLETALHGFSGLVVLWGVLTGLWLLADRRGLREALS